MARAGRNASLVHWLMLSALMVVPLRVFASGPPFPPPSLADRMPQIPADKLTAAQKEALAKFRKIWLERTGRKDEAASGVFGPYVDLLRSPEVLLDTVRLGTQLQFRSVLPLVLRQFIMAIAVRQ